MNVENNMSQTTIKSFNSNFFTRVPIKSAIFKPKAVPTITKSSANKAEYRKINQTKA